MSPKRRKTTPKAAKLAAKQHSEPAPARSSSIVFAESVDAAKAKALKLLALMARSSEELRQKLARAKFSAAVIEQVIEDFQRAGLINDEALASRLVERELERLPADRPLLEEKLSRRGVDASLVARTVDDALDGRSTWTDALDAARAKLRTMTPSTDPHKAAQRVLSLLLRRGFEHETATEATLAALREAGFEDPTEEHASHEDY
jgi:regulatory protein